MKSKAFTVLCYLAALVLILPNIFTFCSVTRYEEKPPSYSNTKMSDWQKLKTKGIENVISNLDSLLTKEAKDYYASLDEPYAVIVMERSFANAISWSWNIEEGENDFYKKIYKGGMLDMSGSNDLPYQQLKSKTLSICYYRHLNNRYYNFKTVKDSLKKIYPLKKAFGGSTVDFTALYAEEDSITNSFYVKNWMMGDEVRNSFYYEGTYRNKRFSGYYTGIIINKDTSSQKIELRINSITVNEKKVLAFVDPKTKVEIYAIGKTIWQKPSDLTNPGRKEPFRY